MTAAWLPQPGAEVGPVRPPRCGSRVLGIEAHTAGRLRSSPRGVVVLLLAFVAAYLPVTAMAHPHVFIDWGAGLLFSGDRIDGIRLTWTFDDLFSGFILQEFDRDRNGSLSPAEVHQIGLKHLVEFRRAKFFTTVNLNGKEVTPNTERDFTATAAKGIVTYQFTLPLSAPLASTTAVEVVVDDPTYYIAYLATAANSQSQTVGAFLVDCRVAHDKTGIMPDAVRCGVRRR
jgi:ABC-type uncharacterized transport system substrate-binding protein